MKALKITLLCGTLALFNSSCNQADCDKGGDPSTCICPAVIDPVCGCNDVTYENSCRAECAGITEYTEGECD